EMQTEKCFKRMDKTITDKLLEDYRNGDRRLILLDYDGTLVKFKSSPEEAVPDPELRSVLRSLIEKEGNELVVVSGRDKDTLERWFGDMGLNIIAEHGVWIKTRKDQWSMIEQLEDSWKEKIRPVLESYVIKTPGAFVEEKGHSLAWHYRKADQNQAQAQISEMKETLHNMISNLNVGILNGNKVIEIKNIGVNKGRAVKKWTEGKEWDFILAVGDDWTDEDMFEVLPEKGYSIRVGYTNSRARFNLKNADEVRDLIRKIAGMEDTG
ncbi:MAG: trehalose-phosphatase, partial [Candidatus Thermoplasmatota archaeon]|nr:trehalose-phosphatase [Candidatus Thermoplasmatota archaeon]